MINLFFKKAVDNGLDHVFERRPAKTPDITQIMDLLAEYNAVNVDAVIGSRRVSIQVSE